MIGKVTEGSSSIGLLNYCYYEKEKLSVREKERLTPDDVRGEIVYIQNLGIDTLPDGRFDMDYLAKQFRDCADKNQNLKNYVLASKFFVSERRSTNKRTDTENQYHICQRFWLF